MYCNTLLEGEVYCNGYCIAGAVGCVLQYKYCITGWEPSGLKKLYCNIVSGQQVYCNIGCVGKKIVLQVKSLNG